jgi:hypothetical protein
MNGPPLFSLVFFFLLFLMLTLALILLRLVPNKNYTGAEQPDGLSNGCLWWGSAFSCIHVYYKEKKNGYHNGRR